MDCHYGEPFQLLHLPAEIRNRIYFHVLCAFEEAELESEGLERHMQARGFPERPNGITQVGHSINTSILRTCKQVHREAYDVMFKMNQFIHIEAHGIHLADLLCSSRLPLVTMDRQHAVQFLGYVLSVTLTGPASGEDEDPGSVPYFSFIILGSHLDRFCRIIDEGDMYLVPNTRPFSEGVTIDILVNPIPPSLPSFKASTEAFVARTQQSLLQPFRKHIHGMKKATIRGNVSLELADDVISAITSQRWAKPDRALEHLTAKKENGNRYFRESNSKVACTIWSGAAYDIDKIIRGPSFGFLAERGGNEFVNRLLELLFLTNLNLLHIFANDMSALPYPHDEAANRERMKLFSCAEFFVQCCYSIYVVENPGMGWRPTSSQTVKLTYRYALCIRLMGRAEMVPKAVENITTASHLAPRDEAVLAEKENILAWKRQINGEVPLLGL